ncbi:MAG: DNA replication/repair protein RecF [Maricaulaceae bacterium]|nr:DNA replication/repair protein RecF [Maricaulaceae bacterium]
MSAARRKAAPAPARPAAAILKLRLTDFRVYAALDLAPDPRPVCLSGPNGAGKTNILEAISLLAPGKGLRGAETAEIARSQDGEAAPGWAVWAEGTGPDGAITLAAGAREGARRETRLNSAPATRAALARALPMIALSPGHDRLFADARAERLKFFDRLAFAADPALAEAAGAYEKLRARRQRLLDEHRADPDWLAALEADMAAHGSAAAAARLDALARLQAAIENAPDGAFPKADLSLDGAVEADLAAGMSAAEAEDRFAAALRAGRGRDAAAGRTLTRGPHRTELRAVHRGKNRPAGECSTGEQKALVLRLVMAQAEVLRAAHGAAPVLLLDEACAHLDAARREGLAEMIAQLAAQAWLTGVDAALFAPFGAAAQHYAVEAGRVRESA